MQHLDNVLNSCTPGTYVIFTDQWHLNKFNNKKQNLKRLFLIPFYDLTKYCLKIFLKYIITIASKNRVTT